MKVASVESLALFKILYQMNVALLFYLLFCNQLHSSTGFQNMVKDSKRRSCFKQSTANSSASMGSRYEDSQILAPPWAFISAFIPLIQLIRQSSSSMNTFTLISTIRSAAQKLLDCDRATVFIKEGNYMMVKAQGIENEIPGGFSVPIGKGIISNTLYLFYYIKI